MSLALRRAAVLAAALLLATAPFAGAQSPFQPGAAPEEELVEMPQPPDGVWHTDEQGRQYFPLQIPKVEGQYQWLDDKNIVLRYGMRHEVLAHDDKTFTVKIFQVDPAVGEEHQKKPPTEEERAKVAATYRPEAKDGDRLSFASFADGLPTTGQWRNGFEIADMNGDGHLDIVHGPARKGENRRPNIFLGDGKGSWRAWREATFPALAYDYGDVAVADFNGDKRPDLALAVHLRGILVLVAAGPASFEEWGRGVAFDAPSQGGSSGFASRTLEAADWDRDGRIDLVALGEGPRMTATRAPVGEAGVQSGYGILIYLNQGDGSWRRKVETGNKRPVFGDDLEVADLNGDRRPDLVLSLNVIGTKHILRFGAKGGEWSVAELTGLRPAILTGAVHAVDLNGDRRTDLAIAYIANELGAWRTGIDLFYAGAKGGWERKTLFAEEGRRGLYALDSGDLDGDGRLDLAALTGDGEVWVFLGEKGGGFAREASTELPPPLGCRGYDLHLVDLDGDGRDEMVAGFAGESSALFAPDKCLSGGALQAWKAGPRSALTASSPGS